MAPEQALDGLPTMTKYGSRNVGHTGFLLLHHDLAIEYDGRGGEGGGRVYNCPIAIGPVVTVAVKGAASVTIDDQLSAIAVVLRLVADRPS